MERAIGILIGILLGIAIVVAFVFLGSRDTIDDPSIDESGAQTTIEAPATAPPEPAPEVIQLRGGEPVGGVRELTYTKGDQVQISVELDEPQEDVHIHGYDIEFLSPARSADFDFKADIEGIFEIEAHGPSGDVVLAEIRVEPS